MLWEILVAIIVPIFALIGVGVALDRRFHLDLDTLSKLNFYVFVPALSFVKLLEADISAQHMMTVGVFSAVHAALLLALAWGIFSLQPFRAQRTVLSMGAIFSNAGNYGIPLVLLAFGDAMIGVIVTIMVVQNLLSFTLGVWMLERGKHGFSTVLAGMGKVPVVIAVILALLLRAFKVEVPSSLAIPLGYLADGLIPVALLTLGAQLARTRFTHGVLALSAVTIMRLLISPLLAAVLLLLFPLSAPVSSVIIVAAGFPVAVNLYILAAEYNQDATLASQSIFLTTLISALTVTVLLMLVR